MNPNTSSKLKQAVVLLLPVLLLAGAGLAMIFPTASNQGYQPTQPIPYSHKLHAGNLKIPCQYCHVAVERSRHASIPSLNVCMNCHSVVKQESPHIQAIKAAYDAGKPIEWVRIHELPDYVYFPHKRHIAAGLACETCHGDIKGMEKVYQHAELTMGWCMDCHRGVTTPREVLNKFHPEVTGVSDGARRPVASTECSTCHN